MSKNTMEEKANRFLAKNVYIDEYIRELNHLTQRLFTKADILSREKSNEIFYYAREKKLESNNKFIMGFNDKKDLITIITKLHKLHDPGIYVLTDYSNYCGIASIDSLMQFNWNFKFTDEHSGSINLLTTDFKNAIQLDFSEENNTQIIEVEIFGSNWKLD